MRKQKALKNSITSYLLIFLCGIIAGIVTRLTDFCKADSLWSFSSIATLFGFWIVSVTVIVLLSSSHICAGVSSFLYLFGMTLSFYGLLYILGLFLPRFDNGGFKTQLFLIYSLLSAVCGVGAFILYYWERKSKVSAVLYALPIGALLAETLGVGIYLANHSVFLFQLLFDLCAVVILGRLFYRRTENKIIYCVCVGLVTAGVYFGVYAPFLGIT